MSEHPTIPQIVRALTTLEDRQGQKLADVCKAYEKKIEALAPEELPPLAEGEYFHFEYVQWNSVEEGGYYSNLVDLAYSRKEAVASLRTLIADESVYAIHVRRYEMPDKNAHAYDEIQRLPVAQSQAYMERLRADKLEKDHDEIVAAKAKLETGYEKLVASLEDEALAYKRVAESLMDTMRAAHARLRRDLDNCTYSEPGELIKIMFGNAVEPDERWERQYIGDKLKTVRKERKHREAVQRAQESGDWPLAPLQGASDRRRCACKMTWHMDEVPPWHNGLECQKPTHEAQVAWARKTTVWPVAKMSSMNPLKRTCSCGKEWEANRVPSNHNGLECQPEMCETVFNGGLCAGEKDHNGLCSPHPKDFVKCQADDCEHVEASHVQMLPEEGGHTYCNECGMSGYVHEFTPKAT